MTACCCRVAHHQHRVQTLCANCADKALRDTVRLRRPKCCQNDLDAFAAKHLVKALCEFLIAVANQKPTRLRSGGSRPRQASRLLRDPRRVRIRRAPRNMHAATPELNEEQHIQSLQPQRFDREEIDGDDPARIRADELAPRLTACAGWAEAGSPKPDA